MRENYFLAVLGEIISRMNQETARYAIALPDNEYKTKKVRRIPRRVRQLLKLDVLLVNERGRVRRL